MKHQYTSLNTLIPNAIKTFRLAWGTHKGYVSATVILNALTATLQYVQLGVFGLIVNEVIEIVQMEIPVFTEELMWLVGAQFVTMLAPSILNNISNSITTAFRLIFLEDMNIRFIQKLGELDVATRENPDFNDKFNNINERGIHALYSLWSSELRIITDIIALIVSGAILFSVHWVFLLFALVGGLPILFVEIRHGTKVFWIWDGDAEQRRKFFTRRHHFMYLPYLIELKLFQMSGMFVKNIQKILGAFNAKQLVAEKKRLGTEVLASLVFHITLIASVILLIQLTVDKAIMIGTMTFVFGSIRGFQNSTGSFFKNLGAQEEHNRFGGDALTVMEMTSTIVSPTNPTNIDWSVPPRIEFRNVSFKYLNTDKWVLKDFNLVIESGENLSIVGVNGAGKTTIIRLLNRFYDPNEGQILLNNVDLREIDMGAWKSQSAVLFQEYADYESFTVAEAIALGRPDDPIDMTKVIEASERSDAHGFISDFELKYEQVLGNQYKGGVELSVGQRQKMALARVFYRNAQVVILDEPTASIDPQAEEKIFERITAEMKEKTVIIISHRFSTVRRSDKICVIEGGRIIEYGSHEELVALAGTYAELYELQARAYA